MKLLSIAFILALIFNLVNSQSCPNNEINCKICNNPSVVQSPMQIMPRISLGSVSLPDSVIGQQVAPYSNYLQYVMGTTDDNTQLNDINNYLEGILLYILIPLLSLIFVIPFSLVFCCGRYCCCCIKGGCCGNSYPTPKGTKCCGCCGFNVQTRKYGWCSKACAYIYMLLFIGFTLFFAITAHLNGNQMIAPGMENLVSKSPIALSNLAIGLQTPVSTLVLKTVIPTIGNVITNLNNTIQAKVNFPALISDIYCLNNLVIQNLPNVTIIQNNLDNINSTINSLPTNDDINNIVNNFSLASNETTNSTNALISILTSLGQLKYTHAFIMASDDLSLTSGNLTVIGNYANDVNNQFSNYINPLSNLPTSMLENDTLTIIQGAIASLSSISGSNPSAGYTARTKLLTNLNELQVLYSAASSASLTVATDIGQMNLNINLTRTSLNKLVNDIGSAGVLINNLSTGAQLNSTIDNLVNALNNVPVYDLLNVVSNLNTTLLYGNGFDLSPIQNEINRAFGMKNKLPCIQSLVGIITSPSFGDLIAMNVSSIIPPDITSMFANIIDQIQSVSWTLGNATFTLNSQREAFKPILVNTTNSILQLQNAITESINSITSFKSYSDLFDVVRNTTVDTSSSSAFINSLVEIDPSVATNMTDISNFLTSTDTDISTLINDINSWVVGGQSPSASINFTSAYGEISFLSMQEFPSLNISAIDQTQLNTLNNTLQSAQQALNSIPDTSSAQTKLNELSSGIAAAGGSLGAALAPIGNIASQIPVSQFSSFMSILNGGVFSMLEMLPSYVTYVDSAQKMIYVTLPRLISNFNIISTRDMNIEQLINSVINELQPIINQFTNGTDLESYISSYQNLIQALGSQSASDVSFGPIFYFYNLYGSYSNISVTSDTDSKSTVLFDSNGNKRPSGQLCLTNICFLNTIEQAYNQGHITDVLTQYLQANGLPNVPLTGNNIFALLIFISLIPVVIGFLSMLCVCTGRFNCSICTSYSICLLMPIISILCIALVPLLLIISDGCTSLENIGGNYVSSSSLTICNQINGTLDSSEICHYTMNVQGSSITLDLDINGIYMDIFSPTSCASQDSITIMLQSLQVQSKPLIINAMNSTLTSQGINNILGPSMLQVVNMTLNELVYQNLDPFFTSLEGALNCATIGPAIKNIKDGICCYIVTPFSFIGSCFFGILLSYILFGIPAGIIGKKRFPLKLWGPFVQINEEGVEPEGDGSRKVAPMESNTPNAGNNNKSENSPRKIAPLDGGVEMSGLIKKEAELKEKVLSPNNNDFDL